MRLLGAELRRFHARRMLLVLLLAGIAAVGMTVFGTLQSVQPLTERGRAQAEQAYEQAKADWPNQVAACRGAQAQERENGDPNADFQCDQQEPQREWFIPEPPTLGDYLATDLPNLTMVLGFLVVVAGATFTAAEASSRSLSTWLTFEPRRLRVLASKLGAMSLGAVLPSALLVGLIIGGTAAAFSVRGVSTAISGDDVTTVLYTSLRLVAITVLLGAAAAALGLVMRHTAAVLGVAVGWAATVEGVARGLLPHLQPWLVLPNVEAWVRGGTQWYAPECTTTSQGTMCDYVGHDLTMLHGGLYLGAVLVVLVVGSALVFRRRDVG